MKKGIAFLLTLILVCATLTGCGETDLHDTTVGQQSTTNAVLSQEVTAVPHEAAAAFAGGSGTQEDPYQIHDATQLALLNKLLKDDAESDKYAEAFYVLTADIVLNDIADFDNWSVTAPTFCWEPMGDSVLSSFDGELDGNGKKIIGMFINGVEDESAGGLRKYGLFAGLKGTVKNLKIEKSYIRVSDTSAEVGTFAGTVSTGRIENCHADTIIEVGIATNVGGICGNGGGISDCSFSGTITQLDDSFVHIGGIVGYSDSVENCMFDGILSGKGYAGGIVGFGSNVRNCVNKGVVNGDIAGGISGRIYEAATNIEITQTGLSIENCRNEGQVKAVSVAGGIVGWMGNDENEISISILNCENKGRVTSDDCVAGVIGKLSVERTNAINISNCTNYADLDGINSTGGIIGILTGSVLHQEGNVIISGCTNFGNITSQELYSAGILADVTIIGSEVNMDLTLNECANQGNIRGLNCAGGILAFSNISFNSAVSASNMVISSELSVLDCNNSGDVIVSANNSMVGGIVGVWGFGGIDATIAGCNNSGSVRIDYTLTEEQIAEMQGAQWTEFFHIAGGIVGRIGDALILSTAESEKISASYVNASSADIEIADCSNTGTITAPDYSDILNKWEQPLYVNYLGGIVGQSSATYDYAFSIENCTYSGADRGFGDASYEDFGTKN